MCNAIIRFHAEYYPTDTLLWDKFQETIQGVPGFHFIRAEINSTNNHESKSSLTLHAVNKFTIVITGLHPGTDSAPLLVKFLENAGFQMNDETKMSLFNYEKVRIVLFNPEVK